MDKNTINLESTITCPKCDFQTKEIMPTGSCQCFYQCQNCGELLQSQKGDCCVFCSYGSVVCPPIQKGNSCC